MSDWPKSVQQGDYAGCSYLNRETTMGTLTQVFYLATAMPQLAATIIHETGYKRHCAAHTYN